MRKYRIFRGARTKRWYLETPEWQRITYDTWAAAMEGFRGELAIRRWTS